MPRRPAVVPPTPEEEQQFLAAYRDLTEGGRCLLAGVLLLYHNEGPAQLLAWLQPIVTWLQDETRQTH